MRIAAMTIFTSASLFRDSVVGSSGCIGTVATCDRLERLLCASGKPLRLIGLASDDTLGDRDNGLELERERAPCADDGRESGYGAVLKSIESDDLRWL